MKKIVMLTAAAILGLSSISLSQADDVMDTAAETADATTVDAAAEGAESAEATAAEGEEAASEAAEDDSTEETAEGDAAEETAAAPEPVEEEPIPEDSPQVKKLISLYPDLVARIQPYGRVCFEGDDDCDITLTASGAGNADGSPRDGEAVFNAVCKTCHGTGVAGAPPVGDSGAWGPRIAKGTDVLYDHAINGFEGSSGNMPARGGADIPDEEVQNAVDYMVGESS